MNRIAAITMAKNEADIVESFCRHTLQFADEMLIVDHASTDSTVAILRKLQAEGLHIRILEHTSLGYAQADVMTALLRQAFLVLEADLVLPLDADEFVVLEPHVSPEDTGSSSNAPSLQVRQILQNLPVNQVYQLEWVNYALISPEEQADTFLLDRPCQRERQPENLGKVIVGKDAWAKHGYTLMQGNHSVRPASAKGEYLGFRGSPLKGLHVAHFPTRSQNQLVSKFLCMWLTNIAQFSRYTWFAQDDYHNFFDRYANGNRSTATRFLKDACPGDVSAYIGECKLRYTPAEVDAIGNSLRLAERACNAYAEAMALLKRPSITVCYLWDGCADSLAASWQSLLQQDYPPREMLLTAPGISSKDVARANAVLTRLSGKNLPLPARILASAHLREQAQSQYIVFMQPGARLQREALKKLVILLECHDFVKLAAISEDEETRPRQPRWASQFPQTASFLTGSEFRTRLLPRQAFPLLSGTMFRRSFLEYVSWPLSCRDGAGFQPSLFWNQIPDTDLLALVHEPLAAEPSSSTISSSSR